MKQPATKPDWRKDHWRQYESPADHAERVERAEETAGRYFEMATVRQKAAYDLAMADLRGLDAPRYTRARAAANAEWARSTAEAADLFQITCDEIMVHAEVPEEIAALWDDLEAREVVLRNARAA
ncbi:hypothetical protein [Bradyrhizobium sp. URHD0069]|uniref:hypothetical protein n=1 Tax=Bradyrhizobium sp. URHD0069 TaxID=1380355 RepID=UPI000495DDAC|nr:hypothetical protein [Bradyrhizobium sp. URHD0069]